MMTNNIASLLNQTAQAFPNKVFLMAGDERMTFGEADRASKDHCRQHMVSFKRPRHVVICEKLPRNTTGKVLRYAS